jgi:uncharacterized protein YyaL (SSP411 family)
MEHESFEDEETAAYMNEHFVCIKVDREEHPDVDHMYMDAVQAIGGSGGWPLNVFVTPERAPFYGGTYYPPRPAYNRPSWMQLMQRMTEIWEQRQDEVAQQSEQLLEYLRNASAGAKSKSQDSNSGELSEEIPARIAESLLKQADVEKGGFGNGPKFPGTMAISFLLEHYHFTGHEPSLAHALHSLDAMMEGGIYDQLGGGFARYATDRNWLIPHFEKMLYDNALLISALCDAYSITKEEKYKQIIDETIAFAERELRDETGGYYCALDADSEGVEGKFYTWTWDDWIAALGENDVVAEAYFGVKREGNWEGVNILHVAQSITQTATENNIAPGEVKLRIGNAKSKLLAARHGKARPLTDDKSLLSWNALMNISLAKAGVVLQNETYTTRAAAHMQWMLDKFGAGNGNQGGLPFHTWKNGVGRIPAKLDDVAYLGQAMLSLATATGENKWIIQAGKLMDLVVDEFDSDGCFFYYTAKAQTDIPVRKVDNYDGATPSANAVMAHNLWLCGMCTERGEWVSRAKQMLHNMSDTAVRYSYSFGYWALLLQRNIAGMKTVVCTTEGVKETRKELQVEYMPQAYLVTSEKKISELPIFEKKYFADKLLIFVCSESACLSPVTTVSEAFSLVNNEVKMLKCFS